MPRKAPHKWSVRCTPPMGLVRPRPIDPTGRNGPTRGQAAKGRWRQTSYGFHVPSDVDGDRAEQRALEQSMRLPPGGAVTGWAACRLHGANFFDGLDVDGRTRFPVMLCVGALGQLRDTTESVVTRDRLDPGEVVWVAGVPCTIPVRAVFDTARTAPGEREAVVAIDMAAAAELVTVQELRDYTLGHPGWRGVVQVRRALLLADEDSRSPNETRTRLVWVLDAGLPRPLVNRPVFDLRGNLLGIADLLDVEAGVVGEYDGADHRGARRHSKDVAREDLCRRVGLEYFKVTGPDLPDRAKVADRMTTTRARAKWLPPALRRWTTVPPPGWEEGALSQQDLRVRRAVALQQLDEAHGQMPSSGPPLP